MLAAAPTVLASGAWLKNAACLLDDGQPHWSPLHGDLGDPQACRQLESSLRALAGRGRSRVEALAHDLHPDFFSTRLAVALAAEWDIPAIGVQHHHAHIGVVMAEHAVDEPAIGLALDGVGLGTDGAAWGGELLWVSRGGWTRLGALWPLALPGGDVAAREPWRMAAAALHAMGRPAEIETRFGAAVGTRAAALVRRMLDSGLNCPPTSSTGRWFDAAAAALGLALRQAQEAQAAMALEQHAARWLRAHGTVPAQLYTGHDRLERFDPRPLLQRLFDWPEPQRNADEAAAWFHLSLAEGLADWAAAAARQTASKVVCLGGGCFFNQVLTRHLERRLQQRGLRTLRPASASCGDAGLALGQAWVAAHALRSSRFPTNNESTTCV